MLSFTADLTQLDQAYARVGSEAESKLGPPRDALGRYAKQWSDTGTTAQGAAKGIGEALDATAENVDFAGEKFKEFGDKSALELVKPQEQLRVILESLGIHLPRGVTRFLAELGAVGPIMNIAFSAGVVFFLIEALSKGVEKIIEWAHSAEKISEAWAKVDDVQRTALEHLESDVIKAAIKLDDLTGNHIEALQLKWQQIDKQTLTGLIGEIKKMQAAADAAFVALDRNSFEKFFLGGGTAEVKKQFDAISKSVETALSTQTPQAFADAMKIVDGGLEKAKEELKKLDDQQKAFDNNFKNVGANIQDASAPDPRARQEWEELRQRVDGYKASLDLAKKANEEEKASADLEERKRQAQEFTAEAKRQEELQLAHIKEFKAEQHAAFEAHNIDLAQWKATEEQATQASTIAHEHYLERVVAINSQLAKVFADAAAKEHDQDKATALQQQQAEVATKAHAAAMELAKARSEDTAKATDDLAKATEKYHESTLKILKEWQNLENAAIVKDFEAMTKATQNLTRANEELSKAQTKFDEANTKQQYDEQVRLINQLAQFHLITEQQKENRLKALYDQEFNDLKASLDKQLKLEQQTVQEAQAALSAAQAAKGNPIFPDAQLLELERNLAKAQTDVVKTNTEIAKATEDYEKKTSGLTLATRQQMQAELQLAQTQHLRLQAQIALGNAEGLDTTKLQQQDKATLQLIADYKKLLQGNLDVLKTKPTWNSYFTELINGATTTGEAVQQGMGLVAEGIDTAVAAAVSGAETFGQAMEKMAAAAIKGIAEIADKKGTEQLALAFAAMSPLSGDTPGPHFASAALWFSLGVAASAAAGALEGASSGKGSSSGTGASTASNAPAAAKQPEQVPVQVVNVQHFQEGALVTTPILAMIHANEGVIPLDDARATRAIADAIVAQIHGGLGGDTYNHYWTIDGVISDDNLNKVVQKISRNVSRGNTRLLASNSIRITRRS